MTRDSDVGKIDYTLVLDGPMLDRWAALLTRGCATHGRGNWLLADGDEELARFKASALRHMLQWLRGETGEDHAAAIWFNVNGAEYVCGRLARPQD